MGIAIIKGNFGANALSRTIQNVTPKDASRRKSFTSNDLRNVIWELQDGVYKVAYIDLGQATQHYKYEICNSGGDKVDIPGVQINEITGTIRLDSNYDGTEIYARVVPITNQYYPTAVSTPAVLVKEGEEIPDTYSLSFKYTNDVGINARPQELSLVSFAIKVNNVSVSTDTSELTNASVVAKVNGQTISSSNNIQTLSIPGNTANTSRTIDIFMSGTYDDNSVSGSIQLPQAADAIDNMGNISYNGSLLVGTTINPNNFKTTVTYFSGKTPYQLSGTSVSPTTIQSGTAIYTVTFPEGQSGEIELTGQTESSAKLHISSLPTKPYPAIDENSIAQNGAVVNVPLVVHVVDENNVDHGDMLFSEYNTQENKETYGVPTLTFSDNKIYDNLPYKTNNISSIGTLTYDLRVANYVYDKTKITGINIPCITNSSYIVNATGLDVSVSANALYTTYFTNMTALKLNDATSAQLSALGITQHSGLHVSSKSFYSQYPNQILIQDSGTYYELDYEADGYYIGVKGGANIGIISASSIAKGQVIDLNGEDVKGLETSGSTMIYIKHTPSSNQKTFLISSSDSNIEWYILTPNNN